MQEGVLARIAGSRRLSWIGEPANIGKCRWIEDGKAKRGGGKTKMLQGGRDDGETVRDVSVERHSSNHRRRASCCGPTVAVQVLPGRCPFIVAGRRGPGGKVQGMLGGF